MYLTPLTSRYNNWKLFYAPSCLAWVGKLDIPLSQMKRSKSWRKWGQLWPTSKIWWVWRMTKVLVTHSSYWVAHKSSNWSKQRFDKDWNDTWLKENVLPKKNWGQFFSNKGSMMVSLLGHQIQPCDHNFLWGNSVSNPSVARSFLYPLFEFHSKRHFLGF